MKMLSNIRSYILKEISIRYMEEEKNRFYQREINKFYKIVWIDGAEVRIKKYVKLKVLLALGEDYLERNELIDYVINEKEDEISYEKFLDNLRQKGLMGVEIFVNDGHLGLESAIKTIYPYSKQQVCIFHKKMDVVSKSSPENRER